MNLQLYGAVMKHPSLRFLIHKTKLFRVCIIALIIWGIYLETSTATDVKITIDSLTIITYHVDPPNPMPRFYEWRIHQGVQRRIYPLPMDNNLTQIKKDNSYQQGQPQNPVAFNPGHVWSNYRLSGLQRTEIQIKSLRQSKDDLMEGIVKAVAYSGFRSGQHPDRGDGAVNPTEEEILEDLEILTKDSNFRLIRLYDSRENSEAVLRLIRENNMDMKVMLGIWLSAELSNHEGCPWLDEPIPDDVLKENKILNRREVENGIQLAREYEDIVVAVNVGNEALVSWTDHLVEVDTVIEYVRKVKNNVSQPVTVAENYYWWANDGADLAKEVDFLAVHTYPIWEGKDIDEGLSFTIENMQLVRDAFPDKSMVIAEAGWATTAYQFGDRASEEKQKQHYKELFDWASEMNITTFWFEAFDEDWKGDPDNPLDAEKHWGLFTVDRKAKLVMQEKYPELAPATR